MKFLVSIITYATLGGFAYAWAIQAKIISPIIIFVLFILYGVLGGILGAKLEKKGLFI